MAKKMMTDKFYLLEIHISQNLRKYIERRQHKKMTKSDERLLDRGASQLGVDDINFLLMTNYLYAFSFIILHSITSFSQCAHCFKVLPSAENNPRMTKNVAIDRKISHYAFTHTQCTLAHLHIHKYGKKFGIAKRKAKLTVQFI